MAHRSSLKRFIVPLVFGFISVLATSAQSRFSQAPTYALGGTVLSAITTDFNHDGRTDMLALVGRVSGGSVSAINVTLATSTGAYTTPKVISSLPANTTGFVGAGDFNHDGNIDFAAALSTGVMQIFLGNGDGTFQAPKTISFTGTPAGLLAGKFTGGSSSDLALFVATNNSSTGFLKLYVSNGNGTFAAPKSTTLGIGPFDLTIGFVSTIGDVNRDGKLDLAVGDRANNCQILLGNGDGTFRAMTSIHLSTFIVAIAISDYDGDANPDLILANEGGSVEFYTGTGEIPSLMVLRGFGDGTFNNTSPILEDAGNSGMGLSMGDFNNDGKADLVVYNGLSSTVAMKLMSPGGRLVFPPIAAYSVWSNFGQFVSLLNGDTNGDGKRDVLVVMKSGVQVLKGTSGGYLRAPSATDLRSYTLDLKSSDFNRDNFADLMIRGKDSGPKGTLPIETLYTAFGNGNLIQKLTTGPGIYSSSPEATLGPLGIGNFDQNGAVDLLIAEGVLFNNGSGTFSAPNSIPANIGTSPHSIDLATVAGDLNRDGKADLITVGQTQLTVTLGNGDGTFKPEVNYSLGGTDGNAVVVRDINGDGKLDAVTANYGSSSVSVFLGKGDGSFQTPKEYTVTANPFDIAIGDFNGDGKLDIAAASATKITILLNNGSGGFTTGTTFTAGTFLEGITAASLRANGLADLMVVDNTENSMRLFYCNGNGTFGPAVVYKLGSTPTSIVSGDFNGDGAPDAAVTLNHSTAIPVFFNQGGVGLEETAGQSIQTHVVTISATVKPTTPGNPTPTGTVTFKDGSSILTTVTLSGGTARFSTTSLSKGQHSVVATYNGNSMYNKRSGGTLNFPVQ